MLNAKRLIALCLTLALVFTAVPASLSAAETAVAAPATVYIGATAVQFEQWQIRGITYVKLVDLGTALKGTVSKFSIGSRMENGKAVGLDLTSGAAFSSVYNQPLNKAASGSAPVSDNNAQVYIDGVKFTGKSYFINGSSYYLLTDLAPLLRFTVARDAGKGTSALEPNGPIVINPGMKVKLGDVKIIDSKDYYAWNIKDSDTFGNKYAHGVWVDRWNNAHATLALNGKYEKLTATVAPFGNGTGEGALKFYSVTDDNVTLLGETKQMKNTTLPYQIEIDVKGVNVLRIERSNSGLSILLAVAYVE